MVVAFAPEPARRLAATRGYLPYTVPLVKRIGAVPGDRACARGADVFINGQFAARRLAKDLRDRPLPWWQGCRTLRAGEALLLSSHVPSAFDGRYFGVTRQRDIVGEAILLGVHEHSSEIRGSKWKRNVAITGCAADKPSTVAAGRNAVRLTGAGS